VIGNETGVEFSGTLLGKERCEAYMQILYMTGSELEYRIADETPYVLEFSEKGEIGAITFDLSEVAKYIWYGEAEFCKGFLAFAAYYNGSNGNKNLIMLPGFGNGLSTVKGMAFVFSMMYRIYAKEFTVYVFSRKQGGFSTMLWYN
jgi:hypothetical protein